MMASKRTFGCGCRILALGIHRSTNGQNRSQVIGSALAPPPKRAVPAPNHLSPEAVQTIHVAGHRVVVEVALHHRLQPLPELRRLAACQRRRSSSFSSLKLGRESLADRLALDDEPAGLPGRPAHVREPQEVERLRLALASLLPVARLRGARTQSGASCPGVAPTRTTASGPSIPGGTAPRLLDVRIPRRYHRRSGRRSCRPWPMTFRQCWTHRSKT